MKFSITLFLVILIKLVVAQGLSDSLLLFYPFSGNAIDASGNGFDATITTASLTYDRLGNPNSAYHFNGVDQYIDWPADSVLKPDLPVSFAFWIYIDNLLFEQGSIFDTDFSQNDITGVTMMISSTLYLSITYGDGSGSIGPYSRRTYVSSVPIQQGAWYYIIAVVNGPNDMEILINCESTGGAYSGTGGTLAYSSMQGTMGRHDVDMFQEPYYFEGVIDEFRYWNRALDSADAQNLCKLSDVVSYNKDAFKIYPNPASDYVFLKDIPDQAALVELINIQGKVLSQYSCDETIYIGDFEPGYYLIRLIGKDGEFLGVKSLNIR